MRNITTGMTCRKLAKRAPDFALEHAVVGGLTVGALSARFLEDYARSKNLNSTRKYEQAIARQILPHLRDASVDALDREQVRGFICDVRVPGRVPIRK